MIDGLSDFRRFQGQEDLEHDIDILLKDQGPRGIDLDLFETGQDHVLDTDGKV